MNQRNKLTTLIRDGHRIRIKDLFLNGTLLTITISVDGKRAIPGTRRFEIEGKPVPAKLDRLIDIALQKHIERKEK